MGISAIFGTLAFVGFVVFIAGAALAVIAASQGRAARGGVLLAIIGLVGGILFSVISQGIIVVEPTQVAIITNTLTGSVETPRRGGTHVVVPVIQRVAVYYPITQQEYTMAAALGEGARSNEDDAVESRTKDGQTVKMDVTILYHVVPDKANELYLAWNDNYIQGFVRPIARSLVREIASKYTAEQIYGEARTQLGNDIKDAVAERFAEEDLELTDFLVRNITFSDEFTTAIEQKVVAAQNLERARTEAQQRETEAKGRAAAAVADAQGAAQAVEIQAKAQAEALRLVSEQIAANPSLIPYEYVQNLSDNVQLVLLPSNSPFLFDLQSLMQANPNFTPPTVPEPTPIAPSS
jgi:regulator of protease activity HflC (stomatin/prohibitin superfamily)